MDAAIRKAKDSFGTLFDKNLHDLVRGIRNHKENEAKYIAECIEEIKQELKQDNMAVKANAINKLCYLEMLGYDISWASFNIVEVMSSTKFTFKRIGYLAASQCFHEGTDVVMLTTNMIRKDLCSQNMYETGIALSGLSCFLTPDLARDLASEIMSLMTSSKPYIRKKAVQIMYKIFLKYPDALRPTFPRLKEKLDDPESSVQAAAVNVICELARKNPKNYLSLAPIFFKLMTVSTNNWVLIKIIKLFGALTPLEPRLGKKLIEPLTNLINSTSAMSLLYECINTVLAVLISISSGQPNHNSAIQICLQKLRILIEDSDQNLKYLGLLAMSKILLTNPKSVQTHKDLIMQCLDDKDESIRLRSLDLLYGMVSKKNLMEIIKKLMMHMNKAEGSHYRDELLAKIVDICSQNNYQHVINFEWYVSVLVELTRMEGTRHGKLLSSQMLDVAIRVETIRPFIVSQMSILLDNIHVFTSPNITSSITSNNYNTNNTVDICEVLYSATWICGEFAEHLQNPTRTLEAMLKSKINNLPGHIQAAFVQNIFKLYSHLISKIYSESLTDVDTVKLSASDFEECKRLTEFVVSGVTAFQQNADIEVQERACTMIQILKYIQKMLDKYQEDDEEAPRIDLEIACLFEGELNPVAAKAQKKVPIPEGLDLDEWINDPPSDEEEEAIESSASQNQIFVKNDLSNSKQDYYTSLSSANVGGTMNYGGGSNSFINMGGNFKNGNSGFSVGAREIPSELSQEDLNKLKENRKLQTDSNPFYIKSGANVKKSESTNFAQVNRLEHHQPSVGLESIRSQSIDLKTALNIPGVTSSENFYRMSQIDIENKKLKKKMKNKDSKKKNKKGSKQEELEDEEDDVPLVKVLTNEMPEGVLDDSDDDLHKQRSPNDPHRALDIDLDEPLKANEKIPTPTHRVTSNNQIFNDGEMKKSEKPKKEKKSKKPKKAKDETESSKKVKRSNKNKTTEISSGEPDLLIQTLDVNQNGNEYRELISPNEENKMLPNLEKEDSNEIKKETNDDLDFWLSTADPVDNQENEPPVEKDENESEKKLKSKKSKSSKKGSESETKKSKKEKKDKKSSKSSSKMASLSSKHNDLDILATHVENTKKLKDIKLETGPKYHLLASNKTIQITYNSKPNYMNLNQIVIDLRLKNLSNSENIFSIELNMLDTAAIKLIRDENASQDSLKIPFTLEPGTENHIEYFFNCTECTFPQRLKGTFTYMLMNKESGSSHEKIDFKLKLCCSTFLIKNSCDNDDFAKWLGSGQLNAKYSVKCKTLNPGNIESIINRLCTNFDISIVECVDNSASLFTSSIQNHPICILVKFMKDDSLTIDGKSTNQSLLESVLEEFRLFCNS